MIDKSFIYGEKSIDDFSISVKKYTCKKCGNVFFSDVENSARECVLCGNESLLEEDYKETRNLHIIPFEKTIDDAHKDYNNRISWNPIVPIAFKKKKKIVEIQKVFLPTFLVNADHTGNITFLTGDREVAVGDKGRQLVIKKYESLFSINIDYNNVLLSASSKVDNKLFANVCEYDYSSVKDYNFSYIKDTYYVLGDVGAALMGTKERERLSKYTIYKVRNTVNHTLKKLKSDETSIIFHDAIELLVPVYIVNVNYRGKLHQYYMNGQNGNSYLKVPIGILETLLFSIIVGGIIFLVSYLLVSYF